MEINKSSRHSKITGDFSESLILYWLSKYGFECALVDHTGIDIIANNPHTNEVMGISVKSRSRNEGKEGQYVAITNDNFPKVERACKAFNCKPYFAIVVDEGAVIYAFITSMKHMLKTHPKAQTRVGWKMSKAWLKKYDEDPNIKMIKFDHSTLCWW
jgi:hypothetical protein